MNRLNNQIKANEAALQELNSVEEQISEMESLSGQLAQENNEMIHAADLDNRKAIDEITRNRTRLEMIPVILKTLRQKQAEAIEQIRVEVAEGKEILRTTYPEIKAFWKPKAVDACVEVFGEEFRDWHPNTQGEKGLWNSQIFREKINPSSRHQANYAQDDSTGLEQVNEELTRVVELLKEMESERATA